MENVNNNEYIAAYKKLYSNLCNFHTRLKADYGGYFYNLFSDEDTTYETFTKYFSEAYVCKKGVTDTYCFPSYSHGKNNYSVYQAGNSTSLVLNDGMVLIFNCFSSECTSSTELKNNVGCVRIRADVNGFKKPNIVGKDIFDFYITEDRIIARGDPDTTEYSSNYGSPFAKGYKILVKGEL